jgi:hypothetical protein
MYNDGPASSPVLTNCRFEDNEASNGGGMCNYEASPSVTGCTFAANTATSGGGMCNWKASPNVTDCTFEGNTASYGGGLYDSDRLGQRRGRRCVQLQLIVATG